ncbi:MAG: 4-alpha-glucanotransferase, partial [Bacteroidales bacterium]|nr:4-alpha-glucanotransferase [Bacteroidales bacterium]
MDELVLHYRKITGIKDDFGDIVYNKKKFILANRFQGELENLSRMFNEAGFVSFSSEITRDSMKHAIGEFLLNCPVYKLYSDFFPITEPEKNIIQQIFTEAERRNSKLQNSLLALKKVFTDHTGFDNEKRTKAIEFFLRCMQFTGPLMAKGVEDTAMYYYNSFIARNEVGDSPESMGMSVEEFHLEMQNRQKNWPMTMNATSTHDTKRGEDVRARLNVISEIPGEWMENVEKWMEINKQFKTVVNGSDSPTVNEEYFIYQTLAGTFPFNQQADEGFINRLEEYLLKSLREAKTDTNWVDPDEAHEKAVLHFTRSILNHQHSFLNSFIPFQQKISQYGIINSLSQVFLKATCPGIPDFYQGTELWDLSMVDPDNRRPVDYVLRHQMLKEMIEHHRNDAEGFYNHVYNNRQSGGIKLWMTWLLMQERRKNPGLFQYGKYIPLTVEGKYKDHVMAFARKYRNEWFLSVIPLFLASLPENRYHNEPAQLNWEDTRIILPDYAPKKWNSSVNSYDIYVEDCLYLSGNMRFNLPFFVKGYTKNTNRHAGILAHISSLPGNYGTGDLGNEGYDFVDFLHDSGQSFWQVLPFNPVENDFGYSPYSSHSAFAGNVMFISPEILSRSRLVSEKSLSKKTFKET